MSPDLAQRILDRQPSRAHLTAAKRTEILMDWLEGLPYREIQIKHEVSKSVVSGVVVAAKREAKATLERISRNGNH